MKATITLYLDSEAAELRLRDLYEEGDHPTAREHFEEYLRGFVCDEMNIALWPDFEGDDDSRPAVLEHVRLTVGGKTVYDEDWSYRAEEAAT